MIRSLWQLYTKIYGEVAKRKTNTRIQKDSGICNSCNNAHRNCNFALFLPLRRGSCTGNHRRLRFTLFSMIPLALPYLQSILRARYIRIGKEQSRWFFIAFLLHCYTLCQISRLVHIQTSCHTQIISKQLQRNHCKASCKMLIRFGNVEGKVGCVL